MKLDVLAFAAHPDDVEMGMGATMIKLFKNGLSTGIIDFTKGELATRGTKEIRMEEAAAASKILGLSVRENLNLPDGKLTIKEEYVKLAVQMIRKYKPEIIFATYFVDRHPDHEACGELIKKAMFMSGLPKYESEYEGKKQEAYRPKKIFYYMMTYDFPPTFIVDVTETFNLKMEAIKCYKSQIYNPESDEPQTLISQKGFFEIFESRARVYGLKIRKEFGEAFFAEEPIEYFFENFYNKGE